jgi:hypothetical protein
VSVDPNTYLRQAMEKASAARARLEQFSTVVAPNGEVVDPRVGQALRALDEAHQAVHVLYVSRTNLEP